MKSTLLFTVFMLVFLLSACGPSAEQLKLFNDFKSAVDQLVSQEQFFQETESSMEKMHADMEQKYNMLKTYGINISAHDSILAVHQKIVKEHLAAREAHKKMIEDYKAKLELFSKEMPSLDVLKEAYNSAMNDLDHLKKDHEKMNTDHEQMRKEHAQMEADYAALSEKSAKQKK